MICNKTGEIVFSNLTESIKARMGKSVFLSSSFKSEILRDDSHNVASVYVLNPMVLWGKSVNVTLIFDQGNKLFMVRMSLNKGVAKTWENWSENDEKMLKIEHDEFLEKHLGKAPYDYLWGVIGSNYDPRSGSSMITIRYN